MARGTDLMRMMDRLLRFAIAATALLAAPAAFAESPSSTFKQSCEAFHPGSLGEGGAVASTEFRAAENHRAAYCLLRGSITTSAKSRINYRVDLPDPAIWNQKLVVIGGGGFNGTVTLDPIMGTTGYDVWTRFVGYQGPDLGTFVMVGSDSGHQGRGKFPSFEASWAADNPDAVTNYAYRANHLVLWAAVNIAKQFYGREPERRYMMGASNGGREGIMAAQHYPEDYDGVLSLAPALSISGSIASMPTLYQHVYQSRDNWLDPDALGLFTKAEIAACDKLDGLQDGVIANYKACSYDGAPLACSDKAAVDPKRCLTPGQIATLRQMRDYKGADIALANGLHGYPGVGAGATAAAYNIFMMGSNWVQRDAFNYIILNQGLRFFTNDPNEDAMSFDASKWHDAIARYSQILDATNPDLSAFFAKGGKMIIWHGVGDTIISYERSEEYVELVQKKVGIAATRKSLRLFVSPTLDHYMNGPEANTVPLLARLEDWVEKGKAPDKLTATRLDPADTLPAQDPGKPRTVAFTRPLCEYGSFPRYGGKGDEHSATSFSCAREP